MAGASFAAPSVRLPSELEPLGGIPSIPVWDFLGVGRKGTETLAQRTLPGKARRRVHAHSCAEDRLRYLGGCKLRQEALALNLGDLDGNGTSDVRLEDEGRRFALGTR
jgi:hypothetical protein